MTILKNVVKATIATAAAGAAASAASKLVKKDFGLAGLKNAAQNLGSGLNSGLDKLKGGLNIDPSQVLNKIPGQSVNEIDTGKKGGNIKTPEAKTRSTPKEEGQKEFDIKELPLRNILSNYASVNYNWTLSVLSPFAVNFPDESYKKGQLGRVIFKSGSADPENRVSLPAYASSTLGDVAKNPPDYNPDGKFDFFIDNVKIAGVIGLDELTKNTNSTTMSFTVFEPYSIGLFFQSLQMAAAQEGYENWVVMPVLLTLEFKGHYSPDDQFKEKIVTVRHFPIKITNIELKVTDRGSQYDCTAVAWNDEAYSEEISSVKTDLNIQGSTVQEMLQTGVHSLQRTINDLLLEQAIKNKIPIPDKVIILFPTDTSTIREDNSTDDSSNPRGATVSSTDRQTSVFKKLGLELASDSYNYEQKSGVNPIGKASMGFTDRRKVESVFGKDNIVWDKDSKVFTRGALKIDSDKGQAHFKQGTQISTIINEVVSSSYYGVSALQSENIENGQVQWYKINSQYYLLDSNANMNTTGRMPTVTVFRIVPYRVSKSLFMPPADKPADAKKEIENALKEYNYFYTGKNTEIMDFQVKFASTFYTATTSDAGINNQDAKQRNKNATVATPTTTAHIEGGKVTNFRRREDGTLYDATEEYKQGKHGDVQIGSAATKLLVRPSEIQYKKTGGGVMPQDAGNIIVHQFQKAINQSGDMITVSMRILGDPFYLGDSGFGNYTAQSTTNDDVTSDGTINYERSTVYIKINFRNPIDINGNLYDFPGPKAIPIISGLYRVNTLESTFDRGLFAQTLELSRMPNYDLADTKSETSGQQQTSDQGPFGNPPKSDQERASTDPAAGGG
jgi:hypothetical protein